MGFLKIGKTMSSRISPSSSFSLQSPCGPLLHTSADEERFQKVKKAITCYLIQSGTLKKGAQVGNFSITILSKYVTYIHPETKNEQSLDLLKIQDPETKRAIEGYYSHWQGWKTRVASNNKGNLNGPEALKRSTEYLKRLPKTFPQNRDKAPQYVKDRFEFVKQFEQDFTKVVSGKMVEVESAIQKAPNDQEKEKLIQKKDQLIHILNEVNQLDRYSLSKVLEKYPEKGPVDIKKVAQAIETEVQADIGTRKQSFIGLFIGSTPELDDKENEYCKDVVGLIYGINEGRKEYFAYCEDVNMSKKKEHINDVFIRAALEYMSDKENYHGDYLRSSYLFDGLSPDLVNEITGENGLKLKDAPLAPPAPYTPPLSGQSSSQPFGDVIKKKSDEFNWNAGKVKKLEDLSKNYVPVAPPVPSASPFSGRSSGESFDDAIKKKSDEFNWNVGKVQKLEDLSKNYIVAPPVWPFSGQSSGESFDDAIKQKLDELAENREKWEELERLASLKKSTKNIEKPAETSLQEESNWDTAWKVSKAVGYAALPALVWTGLDYLSRLSESSIIPSYGYDF